MRIFTIFTFILASILTPFAFKKEFKLPPILESIPPNNPNWDLGEPNEEILKILDQEFSYFANGNQSTVFLSQDGKYVLKLFRYSRSRFNALHQLKNFFKKKAKMDLMTKINKTLNAAYLACTEGKEFTQAIYCHLNLTQNELPHLILHHKRKTYSISLDRYRFALQKKVTPFKVALLQIKNDPEQIKGYMESFSKLLLERSRLNIRNSDPNLGPNFGFLESQAVELDFGNYHKIEPNPQMRIQEYNNLMNRFEEWTKKNIPDQINFLKELRIKTLSSYDEE